MAGEKGNAEEYETGDWRTIKPVWIEKLHPMSALFCLLSGFGYFKPREKVAGIDYQHCKGCGICANECPSKPKALEMVAETDGE